MKNGVKIAVGALALILCSGCTITNGVLGFSESAQSKIDKIVAFADTDLTKAESLAAADALNDTGMAQCLPAFKAWATTLKEQSKTASGVSGAASTLVVKRWAERTIKAGVPDDVQKSCALVYIQEKTDVTDFVSFATEILK